MLKQRSRLIYSSVFLLDLLLVVAAFFASYYLRDQLLPQWLPAFYPKPLYPLARYLPLLPVVLVCWAFALFANGMYRSHRTLQLSDEVTTVVKVTGLATVTWALLVFLSRLDAILLQSDRISRSWVLSFALIASLLLLIEKLALRLLSGWVRQHGFNYRTLAIVGTNATAETLARSINRNSHWGYRLVGFIKINPDDPMPRRLPSPLLGVLTDMSRLLETLVVDDVVFAVTHRQIAELEDAFLLLQEQGIRTRFALNMMPAGYSRIDLEELDGLPLLSFARTPTSYPLLLAKRMMDVALAVVVLGIGLPLVALIAALIRLTSAGNVIFSQTRCGLNGRRFTLYKFRTMVADAQERRQELLHLNELKGGPAFKLRQDPRVTVIGRVLRKFSLDELPQLWNVLRGDMSLVGPRPPIPEEVAQYSRWQRRRLSMKPGITGLWQVSGRNQILDFDRWMELDLEYIDSWSPLLDLKILLRTIPVVLTGRGAS